MLACKAELQANARVGSGEEKKPQEDRQWESAQKETWAPGSSSAAASARPEAPKPSGWIGVSHDLSLADSKSHIAVCQCLAAAAGSPSDPSFTWRGNVPPTGEDTIAVAIGGEGVACDVTVGKGANAHTPVPSIAGTERVGEDVIIDVEEAHEGRPTVHGVLVARPGGAGNVIVRARGALPFGKPADGTKGACKLPLTK